MLASSPQLYSPLSPYSSQSPPLTSINEKNTHTDNTNNSNSSRSSKSNLLAADSTATHDSSKPLLNIRPILSEGHRLVDSSEFGSESYEDEKNDIRLSTSITPRRHRDSSPLSHKISKDTRPITENTTRSIGRGSGTESDLQSSGTHSTISPDSSIGPPIDPNQPRPRLAQVGPHIATATIQAYNFLTVVRSIADPTWMVLKTSNDKSGAQDDGIHLGTIGKFEIIFLALSVVCSLLSCIGFTLRVMDRMSWIRKVPIITSYLQAGFAIVALVHYHATTKLLPGAQYAHGYLTCVLTIVLSCLVTIIMTVDWFRGFPNPGLSVVLKELIISSFVMTVVIIVAAGTYTLIEGWSFDTSVNFCIVSFSTIGYGNVSPQTVAGRVVFFFYGVIGISAVGYFIVSLRNAVLEQFQWRLIERFSKPSHIIRVQTRMSTRDMSFPLARFEEEQRVKKMVKRNMIIRMILIWVVLWFGGAGVFCAFQSWTYIDSLYFCFVTLTTVGFGDMAPTEPGSIEFWNIYVFLGLTVFAYILSLFSDTMASHIHLVDDGDEPDDDDDMYGWEHCEDASNLFANWNGAMGMDGLKWTQQQTLIHANRGQENQHQDNESSVIPGQQGHNDRPKGLQRFRFWKQITNKNNNDGGESGGGGGYGVNEGRLGQQSTTSEHSMDTWHQQKQRARAQRHLSSGRILMVPAKERKQMLEAEYYATHNDPSFDHTNINTAGSTSETTEQNMEEPLERFVRSVPTTIRFVDKFGYPHRRVIGQHINNNHGGVQATSSQQSGATLGTESSGSQGTSIANTTAEGSASEDDRLHPRQRQRYVYSTTGYNDVLTKRRGTLAAMRQQHNYGHRRGGGHRNARSDGYDGKFGNDQDQRWLSSSSSSQFIQNQYPHYQDETIQTGALKHQPTVRFESPYIRHGNGEGSSSSTTPHRAMLQRAFQQQHLQQNQQHQDSWERQQAQSQDHPLSTMDPNNHVIATSDLQPNEDTENEKRDRFITPYSIDYENNDNYTMATTDAFERYLDLDHTRQSHSSDVTKVGSPAAEIYLGEPSPFFANNPKAKAVTSPTTSQLQQRRESELIPGTGIQTPPNSQPATKRLERENEVGPFGETKNSADLPIFDTKVDLNLMGYEAMEQQKQLQEQRRRDPSDPQSPASPIEMQQTSSSMEAAITNTVNAHHVGITMPAAMGLTLGTRSSGVKCHQNGLSGSTSTFDHDFAESDICLVPLNLNAYDVPKAASSVDYTNNNNNNNITNSTNNCTSIGVTIDSETTQNQAISMSKTENASPFSSIRQLLSPPAEPVTPSSLTSFPFSSASSSFSSNNNCSLSKDNNNTKTKGKLPSVNNNISNNTGNKGSIIPRPGLSTLAIVATESSTISGTFDNVAATAASLSAAQGPPSTHLLTRSSRALQQEVRPYRLTRHLSQELFSGQSPPLRPQLGPESESRSEPGSESGLGSSLRSGTSTLGNFADSPSSAPTNSVDLNPKRSQHPFLPQQHQTTANASTPSSTISAATITAKASTPDPFQLSHSTPTKEQQQQQQQQQNSQGDVGNSLPPLLPPLPKNALTLERRKIATGSCPSFSPLYQYRTQENIKTAPQSMWTSPALPSTLPTSLLISTSTSSSLSPPSSSLSSSSHPNPSSQSPLPQLPLSRTPLDASVPLSKLLQEQAQIDDSGESDGRRGPFNERKSNLSLPWFENDVDLNKVGPDFAQVMEARKSQEEIERRSIEILKKRGSSLTSPSS